MVFYSFWSEIGYGFLTQILNWVCFPEEAFSSSLTFKTILLKMDLGTQDLQCNHYLHLLAQHYSTLYMPCKLDIFVQQCL